jgi:hypothetical protein
MPLVYTSKKQHHHPECTQSSLVHLENTQNAFATLRIHSERVCYAQNTLRTNSETHAQEHIRSERDSFTQNAPGTQRHPHQ